MIAKSSSEPTVDFQRHAKDPLVGYGDIDFEIALYLVRTGQLKAFIIPHSDMRNLREISLQLTPEQWLHISAIDQFSLKDDSSIFTDAPDIDVPEWLKGEASRLFSFTSKYKNTIEIITTFPHRGSRGFAPNFHTDANSIDVHCTLVGASLQWTTETLERDTKWITIDNEDTFRLNTSWETLISSHPDFDNTIIDTEIGDIIIFNHQFGHRSSANIPQQGRISVLITDIAPPIFK
jgi:hypothetical protein